MPYHVTCRVMPLSCDMPCDALSCDMPSLSVQGQEQEYRYSRILPPEGTEGGEVPGEPTSSQSPSVHHYHILEQVRLWGEGGKGCGYRKYCIPTNSLVENLFEVGKGNNS